MKFSIIDRKLVITACNQERADLAEAVRIANAFDRNPYWDLWSIVVEAARNTGFEEVLPERIAALTEMPLIGEHASTADDDSYHVSGKVFGYTVYQIRCPMDELHMTGRVVFDLVADYGDEGEAFPPFDSPEALRLRTEAYLNAA